MILKCVCSFTDGNRLFCLRLSRLMSHDSWTYHFCLFVYDVYKSYQRLLTKICMKVGFSNWSRGISSSVLHLFKSGQIFLKKSKFIMDIHKGRFTTKICLLTISFFGLTSPIFLDNLQFKSNTFPIFHLFFSVIIYLFVSPM